MKETEEIALQWIDAVVPISGAAVAKVLVLGGLGSLGSEPPQPDEAFAAELKAQDFRSASLLVSGDDASGKAAVDWAAQNEIDLVSLAGMTCGSLAQTRDLLGCIAAIGAGESEAEAFRPMIRNIGGVRLGFLAFSERPIDSSYTGADILHPLAYDRVRMLQAQCDHVIVFCHAGLPGMELPLPEWRARYRRFVDAGASIVIGMPPSDVTGWEEYRHGLVFYSMGTLADDRTEQSGASLALKLSLGQNGRFTYEVRALEREGGLIRLCQDEAFLARINKINELFFDDADYRARTDAMCVAAISAHEKELPTALLPWLKRGLLGVFAPLGGEGARKEEAARIKALLENESLRLCVLRALNARNADKDGERE